MFESPPFDENLGLRLQRRLSSNRPLPRSKISPTLSYGRHRGPSPPVCRVAAVAIALYLDEAGQWMIPLTLRPQSLQHHGGQISLPGGRMEPSETVFDAALREFHEELGTRPNIQCVCGELSTQYVYASDNVVHPLVFLMDPPDCPWEPDPVEVAEVIPLPLRTLVAPSSRTDLMKKRTVRRGSDPVGEFEFRVTAIRHENHHIWGATALILDQLAQLLR